MSWLNTWTCSYYVWRGPNIPFTCTYDVASEPDRSSRKLCGADICSFLAGVPQPIENLPFVSPCVLAPVTACRQCAPGYQVQAGQCVRCPPGLVSYSGALCRAYLSVRATTFADDVDHRIRPGLPIPLAASQL